VGRRIGRVLIVRPVVKLRKEKEKGTAKPGYGSNQGGKERKQARGNECCWTIHAETGLHVQVLTQNEGRTGGHQVCGGKKGGKRRSVALQRTSKTYVSSIIGSASVGDVCGSNEKGGDKNKTEPNHPNACAKRNGSANYCDNTQSAS